MKYSCSFFLIPRMVIKINLQQKDTDINKAWWPHEVTVTPLTEKLLPVVVHLESPERNRFHFHPPLSVHKFAS